MHKIELTVWKNVPVPTNEGIKLRDYTSQKLMTDCLRYMPPNGIGTLEMKKRIDILTKIDKAKGKDILLEDAEYEELMRCANSVTWLFIDRCFTEFDDTLRKAVKQK